MSSGGASRRLRAVAAHVAAPAEASASATVAKVVLGAGGAALAGHVGYEWRKHGLAESWRKSLQRKGSAFALTEGARWLGIRSGLLHFSAVVRQKRMAAAADVDDAELASAVGDMHSWFYGKTGELNDPKKKEKQTRDAYAKAHPAAANDAGNGDSDPLPTFSEAEVAEHTANDDCWVIIRGKVYDLSPWLASHPGGPAILLKHAGSDATEIFTAVRTFSRASCHGNGLCQISCRCVSMSACYVDNWKGARCIITLSDVSAFVSQIEHSPSAHLWLRDFQVGTLAAE